ncbi:hypothetical protein H9W91_34645 [Streptomyces alfalfae]|uniref:hypothetical protein n=1 Tax=Streptomyces alfalfae TaxID=1642299 RepID=UPI001BA68322|nr:hypothetical protein [Streptomyces alfalfae]QUI36302.1 hypothetical protein H9W91_34645 [Streptomyces alfalfae]
MSRNTQRSHADSRMRATSFSLAVAAVLLSALGVALSSVWVLGVGAWLLISAVLIELIYRP